MLRAQCNARRELYYTPYSFDCSDNTKSYTYYKLDITENKGSTVIQLSELAFTYTVDIHNWEETSREAPTCTAPGNSIQKCTDCGKTRIIEIPVIEHDWEVISGTSSTCFDGGGIYAITASNISFNGGSIDGNSAEWGGGIYLYKGSAMTISASDIAIYEGETGYITPSLSISRRKTVLPI